MLNTSQRWVLGGALTMAAAMGIGRFAYTPLLPAMQDTFRWSFAEAGDVASANYLGYMIGALLVPRVLSTITGTTQPMIWLAASLAASVLSTYLGVLADNFWAWCAVRLFSGIASAFCLVLSTTLLAQQLQSTRDARLANLHFTGVGFGIVLTVLITWRTGTVQSHWAELTVLSAVLMTVAWFAFRTGSPLSLPQPTIAPPSGRTAKNSPLGIWPLVIGYGCFGYGYVVTATFIVAMARAVDGPTNMEQTTWLIAGLAAIPSVYIWQKAADRFGLVATLGAAYLVEAIGVLVAGWFSSTTALVVGAALLGGTFAAITALGLNAARQLAAHDPARAIGSMTAAFALGQLLGPALSGRIVEWTGDFAIASVAASGLLCIAFFLLPKHKDQAI